MDKAAIAKHICEKFGIKWDDRQKVAHLNGVPVSEGMVQAVFATDEKSYRTVETEFLKCDSVVIFECNAKNAIALAA